jgi:hypothetical protein
MNPEALLNLVTIIWASLLNFFRKPSAVANDASKFSIEYGRNWQLTRSLSLRRR